MSAYTPSPARGEGRSLDSMPLKLRLAFFDKGFRRFLVVGGLVGARMVEGLGVETGLQRQPLRIVDVALDITERDRRPLGQRHRKLARGGIDLRIGSDARDDA